MIWKVLKRGINPILNWAYPPQCLHCLQKVSPSSLLFCPACAAYFEPIDPSLRCLRCFGEHKRGGVCKTCREKEEKGYRFATVFKASSATQRFITHIEEGVLPVLYKTAACWLFLQWDSLGWPKPDYLIPLSTKWGERKTLLQIGRELSKQFKIPMQSILWKTGESEFFLRKKWLINNQKVLFFSLSLSDKEAAQAVKVVQEDFPEQVYALALLPNNIVDSI